MTHPSENELQAFLDGELADEHRSEVAAHLETCAACLGALLALRAAAGRFSEAVALLDAAAPEPAPPRAARRRRRPARPWSTLARAAVLVLVAAGVASAVIPGSPVREWVASLALGDRGEGELPAGERVDLPPGPSVRPEPSPAGISVAPEDGVLRIAVTNFAPESSVRVRLVGGTDARVRVEEGAEARFRIGPGRIEVAGSGRGDLLVDLPRSAREATVEVDGRIAVLKRGEELQLLRPAVDSLQGDVRFRIGP